MYLLLLFVVFVLVAMLVYAGAVLALGAFIAWLAWLLVSGIYRVVRGRPRGTSRIVTSLVLGGALALATYAVN